MTEEERKKGFEKLKTSLQNSRYYAVEIDDKNYVIDKKVIKALDEKPFNEMTDEEFKIYQTKFNKTVSKTTLKFFSRVKKDLKEDLKDQPHAGELYAASLAEIAGNLVAHAISLVKNIHDLELFEKAVYKMINYYFERRKEEIMKKE